jgi:hypothetical protein
VPVLGVLARRRAGVLQTDVRNVSVSDVRVVGLASGADHLAGLAVHQLAVGALRVAEIDLGVSDRRYALVPEDRDAAGALDVLQVAGVAGSQGRLVLLPHAVAASALVDPDIAAAGGVVHQAPVGKPDDDRAAAG